MNVWVVGWMDRWMDGWMDGWMEGWKDKGIDEWKKIIKAVKDKYPKE